MSERSTNPATTERLAVNLFGEEYSSPLVVASGTLIETFEEIDPYIEAGAGAVIPRSTRQEMVRKTHPSPHLYMDGKGQHGNMINGEWTGADINYWRQYLETMAEDEGDGKKVIMSISGRDIAGCVAVCKE